MEITNVSLVMGPPDLRYFISMCYASKDTLIPLIISLQGNSYELIFWLYLFILNKRQHNMESSVINNDKFPNISFYYVRRLNKTYLKDTSAC